jgi:hypothetical protein
MRTWAVLVILLAAACAGAFAAAARSPGDGSPRAERPSRDFRVVHVFVALCDNRNQGIVPVPESLGDGQDPAANLYWGARYGVKTFFSRAEGWKPVECRAKEKAHILDQAAFGGVFGGKRVYVVAQAYDGAHIREAIEDFLQAAAGRAEAAFTLGTGAGRVVADGPADMACFVGHNGLMDFELENVPENDGRPNPRCAVVLACKSRDYFLAPLARARCPALITTTSLMAPEAYTLDAIIRTWAGGANPEQIRRAAAESYAEYQKCSVRAAMRLFAAEAE